MPNRLMGLLADGLQGASNAAASNVSAPVDMLAWALRKAGVPVGDAPIGGSDWMAQKGLTRQPTNQIAGLLGESLGGVAPIMAAAKAPQIARGLLHAGENMAARPTMNPQAGAVLATLDDAAPQAEALATAQRNAALPVSKGGLGLRPDNTPLERAQAMGYVDDINGDVYRGTHQAPMSDSDAAAPAYALDRIYPDDVYSSRAAQYYGHGQDPAQDAAVTRSLQALRGRPDAPVTVFRAVPKDAPAGINHGDWVTPNKAYAVEHGEGALNGDYKVLFDRVPAKSLFTNADSIYEFGLDKTQKFADGPASLPIVRSTIAGNRERSRFAAFDPLLRDNANLLAGIGGMGLLSPFLFSRDEKQ